MHNAQRYAFTTVETQLGEARFRPNLPLTLAYQDRSVAVSGLLDTGAVINVDSGYHIVSMPTLDELKRTEVPGGQ